MLSILRNTNECNKMQLYNILTAKIFDRYCTSIIVLVPDDDPCGRYVELLQFLQLHSFILLREMLNITSDMYMLCVLLSINLLYYVSKIGSLHVIQTVYKTTYIVE